MTLKNRKYLVVVFWVFVRNQKKKGPEQPGLVKKASSFWIVGLKKRKPNKIVLTCGSNFEFELQILIKTSEYEVICFVLIRPIKAMK